MSMYRYFVGVLAFIMAGTCSPATAQDITPKIVEADPVPTVPIGQPFKLRPGEVYDLPSGNMLSFRFASSSSSENIAITAGEERSKDMSRGQFFTPSTGCQIDYIDLDRSDRQTETATLRVSKC